jgi:peptide/nickel transport system permease protein
VTVSSAATEVARASRLLRLPRPHPVLRSPALVIAGVWLVLVVGGTLLASFVSPYGPLDQDLVHAHEGPSARHWLGTDVLGRDILSRILHGAGATLSSVLIALAVYVVLGVVLGLIAGYAGGWADRVINLAVSLVITMPGIIVLYVVLSVYRGNIHLAMAIFGFLSAPIMVLLVRSSALSVRNELFVDAAKVSGLGTLRIVFSHVLPRSRPYIIVQATVFAANAILVDSGLSFLGFGIQPPAPSWGNMISEAAAVITLYPWMIVPTGVVIALTALSLGVIGDGLRNVFAIGWTAPKLTRSRGSVDGTAVPMGVDAVLSVRELQLAYSTPSGLVPVVKHVSFDVRGGEVLAIVGESGSGKSTVAHGVLRVGGAALVTQGGAVGFDGVDLQSLSDAGLARYRGSRIGYVAQEPMVALSPSHRIRKQLGELVRRHEGLTGDANRKRVLELLTLVELRDPATVMTKYPHELSGGMAQRVSIAFALAGRPRLLVADEPTTALDVTVQAGILGLLKRLQEQTGMAMILITHDWGVVADISDRVAVMYRGEIVEEASALDVFHEPRHPYTRALLASNPHGATPGQDLPVVVGTFPTPLSPVAEPELAEARP